MNGPEHYREAERLLTEDDYESSADTLAAAQVHATLALAAATLEAADQHIDTNYRRPLILRPTSGDDVDPPYPGSPWGRALYGDPSKDGDQ